MQGPVLQPFAYDEAHPYAAGQHRGIDIGAAGAGETVVAPAAGTVSFAGTVPTSGKSVTIETADGYSVTLTHLGSIRVANGAVGRRARRDRHHRSERHARVRPAVCPSRDPSHGRCERLPRSARVPAAGLGRRCNGERSGRIAAGLERQFVGHACAERERDASGGVREPILLAARTRSRPACRPGGASTALETASRGSNRAHERSQEPRSSRSRNGPGKRRLCGPCVRRAGEFAWTARRRALCHGRLSSRRLQSSRPVSTPATRSGPTVPALQLVAGAAGYAHRACAADPQRRRSRGRSRGSAPGRPRPTSPARHAPCRGGSDSSPAPTRGDTAARVARCLRSREPALRPRSRRLV